MFLFNLNYSPFFEEVSVTGASGGSTGELSKEDIFDELSKVEDNDKDKEIIELGKIDKSGKEKTDKTDRNTSTSKEKEEADEDEDEDEKSLEEELEEELEEPKDEELELNDVQHTRKEILAKYPNLFKEFPGLQAAYYRERRYSEILPTLEDAHAAVEKSSMLDNYGHDLANGSIESILRDTKTANTEAFSQIADNYLEDLFKVDKDAYYHVIGNNIKAVIEHAVTSAKSKGDDNLREAARILYEFTFGTDKWIPPQKLGKISEKNDKEEELTRKEQELEQRRINEYIEDLDTKISNSIKGTIDKFIDTNEEMTPYIRSKAISDVQDELEDTMKKDNRFMGILQKLHERAIEDDFSKESTDRIKSAMFSKAKLLLPDIIKKIRRQALTGQGKKVQSSEERDRKGPLPVGQHRRSTTPTNSAKTNSEKAKSIPRGMSTLEFLNQD